jgi:hypothetical protein
VFTSFDPAFEIMLQNNTAIFLSSQDCIYSSTSFHTYISKYCHFFIYLRLIYSFGLTQLKNIYYFSIDVVSILTLMRLHDQLQANGGRLRCVEGNKSCAYIVARRDDKAILGHVDEMAQDGESKPSGNSLILDRLWMSE